MKKSSCSSFYAQHRLTRSALADGDHRHSSAGRFFSRPLCQRIWGASGGCKCNLTVRCKAYVAVELCSSALFEGAVTEGTFKFASRCSAPPSPPPPSPQSFYYRGDMLQHRVGLLITLFLNHEVPAVCLFEVPLNELLPRPLWVKDDGPHTDWFFAGF